MSGPQRSVANGCTIAPLRVLHLHVVERSFNRAKQWRGLATRYDKLAITYRAGVTICALITWLRT